MTAAGRYWRPLRISAALLVGAVLLWVGGFLWFMATALRPPVTPPHCDGIVALTGGSGRVDTSLHLLEQGYGRLLLVSGVDQQVRMRDIATGVSGEARARITPHITLGREATSTVGNASETAAWIAEHHIHSLIVVTAGYHMQRALLELSRAVPDVPLYPYPVLSPALQHPFHRSTMKLLVWEYLKFLLAFVGPTGLFRHAIDAQ